MTLRTILLILMLFAFTVSPAFSDDWTHIEGRMEGEIYKSFRSNVDDFTVKLPNNRSDLDSDPDDTYFSFTLYGEGINEFVQINCRPNTWFFVLRGIAVVGKIGIGNCAGRKEVERSIAASQITANALKNVLPATAVSNSEKMFMYNKRVAKSGLVIHRFPVTAIGHGVESLMTVAVFPKNRSDAFLIQFDPDIFCPDTPNKSQGQLACADIGNRAENLALRLFEPNT